VNEKVLVQKRPGTGNKTEDDTSRLGREVKNKKKNASFLARRKNNRQHQPGSPLARDHPQELL